MPGSQPTNAPSVVSASAAAFTSVATAIRTSGKARPSSNSRRSSLQPGMAGASSMPVWPGIPNVAAPTESSRAPSMDSRRPVAVATPSAKLNRAPSDSDRRHGAFGQSESSDVGHRNSNFGATEIESDDNGHVHRSSWWLYGPAGG